MAKGIKNKRKQKFKSMKRAVIRTTKEVEDFKKLGPLPIPKKNAFLYPDDPEAVFPQHKIPVRVDFRSEAITPFELPVKSKKLMALRTAPVEKVKYEGKVADLPDVYMGDLAYSLGNIEKAQKRKNRMRIDH